MIIPTRSNSYHLYAPNLHLHAESEFTRENMKYRLLLFKCAETGTRFGILFSQYSPSHRFQILRILLNEKEIGESLEITGNQSDYPKLEVSIEGCLDKPAYKTSNKTQRSRNDNQVQRRTFTSRPDTSYNAEEFDFSGWYCPHCGYAKDKANAWPTFIHCNKCGELVCGVRTSKVSESHLFACCDDCGNSGLLEGEIISYPGKGIDSLDKKLIPENSTKLPQLPSPVDKPALKPPH